MAEYHNNLPDRTRQIRRFLELAEFISEAKELEDQDGKRLKIDSELRNVVKAATYLVLYNHIEATMREIIISIHDEIDSTNTKFRELFIKIQKKVFQRLRSKQLKLDDIFQTLDGYPTPTDLHLKLHNMALDPQALFAGNISHGKVVEIAKTYGIYIGKKTKTPTKRQIIMGTVKKHRNDLAHGNSTYGEVGANISIVELKEHVTEATEYIEGLCKYIDKYLKDRKYLAANQPSV